MAWESRKGSNRRYYTRSRKVRGKVKREYVGTGVVAQQAAWLDAYQRETREIMARLRRLERQEREAWYDSLFEPLDVLSVVCDALVMAELSAAGYVLRKGEWRRPRNGDNKANEHDEGEAEAGSTDGDLAS